MHAPELPIVREALISHRLIFTLLLNLTDMNQISHAAS